MTERQATRAVFVALLLALFTEGRAWAEEDAQDTRIAIQRRRFNMAHELRLSLGSMPVDAFQKGWTGSLSYTQHFNNYFAWEVVQVTAAALVSTNLRDNLIDTFAVPEEDFAAPRFMATTGLELTPIYGKQAFLNDDVVYQALIVGAYGGVIFGDRGGIGDTLGDFRPSIGGGIGYRLYTSDLLSFRADIRDFLSFRRAIQTNETLRLENVLFITLSVSFNLWRDDA